MHINRSALLCALAVAGLTLAAGDAALAQKVFSRGPTTTVATAPSRGGGVAGGSMRGGGYQGGGYRGGWGAVVPGVLMSLPPPGSGGPGPGDVFVDDGTVNDGPRGRPPRRNASRRTSGAPPAGENRLVPDEVVIELANSVSPQTVDALQRRFRLERLEQQRLQLTGTTFYRWRIPDRRSVTAVTQAVEGARVALSVQPNYLFRLQDDAVKREGKAEGDPAQYELAKLHLPQAHAMASGDGIRVAVIDSGIDATHPELAGAIAESFDALGTQATPHKHGTSIAGLIAAHGRLMGAAPQVQLLAIRAFDPTASGAQGTTFNILKGLDWAAANGARVINMSFAGPPDPALHRSLESAYKKGIVLVAAAGNSGAKSPPLYPGADASVIAVSATDADDKIFAASNRGNYISVAAPGVQLLVAIPDGGYEMSSGTSFSAAEISGIVALMLERNASLTPARVKAILRSTAKDLGPKGPDIMFGAGLADAYAALMAEPAPPVAASPRPAARVSTGQR